MILDKRTYPVEMHCFLLDLMKKFELCFSFPDDEEHYLIPELLDKQEPEEAQKFKPEECLNFQYHYPVLPEGLLPRFIVRTHVLSDETPRWRTGAILKFEGGRALVKADVQDKKVFISVSGPDASRRRLLGLIRTDFEQIHRGIRNLHLKLLQREGLIETWQDRERKARVIPIVVRDVDWKIAPLAKLQALPKDGKAVTTWANKDTAWKQVSEGIEKVAQTIRPKAGGRA